MFEHAFSTVRSFEPAHGIVAVEGGRRCMHQFYAGWSEKALCCKAPLIVLHDQVIRHIVCG